MARHSRELDRKLIVAQRRLTRVSHQEQAETDRFLDANQRVIDAERAAGRGPGWAAHR